MKNKFNIINLLFIVGISFVLLGITYAFFNYTAFSDNVISNVGEVYLKMSKDSNDLLLTNVFPETYEHAVYGSNNTYRTNNCIDFTVLGKNTYEEDVYYEIDLEYGSNVEGKERIDDSLLRFELIDITDSNNYVILFSDVSYNDIEDKIIYVDKISNTDTSYTRSYRLRVWYSEDIIISDSDSSADFKASNNEYDSTNSSLELYTNLYSSIKVKIYGDYNKKTCEEYINFETYNSLLELANEYEDGEDLSNLVGYTYPIYLNINNSYQLNTLRVANVTNNTSLESQSASGLVIEFTNIITEHYMNSNGTNVGGWEASEMRTYVNNDIYNAIPKDIRSLIINTTVVSCHGSSDSSNFTTTDKLYLLAPHEVYSDDILYDTGHSATRQLDYNYNNNVSTDNYSGAIKKYNGSDSSYWLRTACYDDYESFILVFQYGESFGDYAFSSRGVSPAFRISG